MRKTRITSVIIMILILSLVSGSAFGASYSADPYVAIVNPVNQSTAYADSLLISVKVTSPKTIRVTLYEEQYLTADGTYARFDVNNLPKNTGTVKDVEVQQYSDYTTTNSMSFFTRTATGLRTGIYKVQVDTIDSSGKTIYRTQSMVVLRAKGTEPSNSALFESQQKGAADFVQSLLKGLFGN